MDLPTDKSSCEIYRLTETFFISSGFLP